MLTLDRNPGEKILIGDDIVITVVSRRNGALKIGVDCPRHIPVMRAELVPPIPKITGIKTNGELIHA